MIYQIWNKKFPNIMGNFFGQMGDFHLTKYSRLMS